MARSMLVSIPAGDDVLEALRGIDFGHDGWVQGVGEIENAELRVASEGHDPRRAVRGRANLLTLAGPASGPYMVTLAQATDDGVLVTGGALLAGVSRGISLAVTDLVPLGAAASDSPKPGAGSAHVEPEPELQPEPAPQPGVSAWASVATATVAAEARPEPASIRQKPERGDRVQHFKFGLCDVVKLQGDRATLRDVHGPGRFREIALTHVEIDEPKERDGKRVFPLRRRS